MTHVVPKIKVWCITITKAMLSVKYWAVGIYWQPISTMYFLSWQKMVRVSRERIQTATLMTGNQPEPSSEEQRTWSPIEQGSNRDSFPPLPLERAPYLLRMLFPVAIHYWKTWQLCTMLAQVHSHVLNQCGTLCGSTRALYHHITSLMSFTENGGDPSQLRLSPQS